MNNLRLIALKPGEGVSWVASALTYNMAPRIIIDPADSVCIHMATNTDTILNGALYRGKDSALIYTAAKSGYYKEIFLIHPKMLDNFNYDTFINTVLHNPDIKFFVFDQLNAEGKYPDDLKKLLSLMI